MNAAADFPRLLALFFTERLMRQRQASPPHHRQLSHDVPPADSLCPECVEQAALGDDPR